jgi:hypothetical protein
MPISFRFANVRISILKLKDWLKQGNQLGIFSIIMALPEASK